MSNTPKIRFTGFDEEWNPRKLSDIGKIITGTTPSTQHPEYYSEDGIPWVTPTDITDNLIYDTPRKLSPLGEKVARVVPAETILVTCIASIGKNTMLANAGSFNQQINALVPNKQEYDPYFLLTESHHWSAKMKREAASGTMQIVNKNDFSSIKTYVPKRPEQESIGNYFKSIDNLIALCQQEYEKLTFLKSACLNKMFPKNGSNTPELRFSGFVGDWNQFKLGTMGTTFTGLSGKTKEDFGHGEGRFVTYMNVYLNPVSDIARTDLVEIDTSQNAVQYGDVFFTTSSETPEEVGMSSVWLGKSDNVYLNSFCFGFRPTMEIDPLYMAYMLRSEAVRKKIIYLAQGISRYNISKNRVMEIEVPLPDLDEQKLIGQYFNSLDKLIALHQCKLEKFKQVKQSMLHNMFV